MPVSSIYIGVGVLVCTISAVGTVNVLASEKFSGVLEEIVVTGSNIRRKKDFETPSPIQTLDIETIESSGAGQVQDLLRTLPVNAGSEMSTSQNSRQGVSQFSLRGLGLSGTLTLINGRRAGVSPITSDDGFFFTDINQYPVNMIGNIEVLTDGASATYGSEAVSGVVNIITRADFEGFEIGAEMRDATNNAYSLNAAFGTSFDGGHFTTFVNYYTQDGNFRGDFDFIQRRSNNNGNGLSTASDFDSGTGQGRYNLAVVDATKAGGFARSGTTVADPFCAQSGPGNFVDGTNCRYNFIDQRRLVAEEYRFQAFSQFNYDLTDKVEIFSELGFSTNEIRDAIGGAVLRTTTNDGGFLVPGDHPFNYFVDDGSGNIVWRPELFEADPTLQAEDVIVRQRPLTSAFDGSNADDIVRQYDNIRGVFGFNADLSKRWSVNGSYMYARTKFSDVQPRSYNAQAYDAQILSGAWNPFGSATATPKATSLKDGATEATAGNSETTFKKFSTHRTFTAETVQEVAEVIFSGDLLTLPSGNMVSAAFGAQYRDLNYNDIADSLSELQLDGRADPVFSIVDAGQDVYALFTEALIPVTDDLEVQLALRYEDYGEGEGGDTVDPKVGVRYQVTDTLQLRGSYGTSFQAPSIRNVSGAVGSGTLDDPRTADDLATPGVVECSLDTSVTEAFNSAQITTGADLDPQSAKNYNLGLVFQSGGGFTGSVDYWIYDYQDLIQTGEDFQTILDRECVNGVWVADSRVVRDPSGQLNSVTSSFINVGEVEARGFDLGASYVFDDVMDGQLVLDVKATYVTTFDIDAEGNGDVFDGADNRNSFIGFGSLPDLRVNAGFTWRSEMHLVALNIRYIDGYRDDSPATVGLAIDSYTAVDLQYGISLEGLMGRGITDFTLGVNNVLDEDPPEADVRIAYDGEVHDPRGRIAYLRVKHAF